MSRWFRHYAGMVRDDKLVRVSIKSKQAIERVVWVWSAILESAAEIDDGGRYEIDHAEMARFLRCPASKLADIEDALRDLGRISEGVVAKWSGRQFQSDRSAARTKRYRDARKGVGDGEDGASRDADVTSQHRHRDAPDTETEADTEKEKKEEGDAADAASGRYAFKGGTIRLTAGDLSKWRRTYHAIPDIEAELLSLDGWFEGNPEKRKNWFHIAGGALNRKHQEWLGSSAAAAVVHEPIC